MDAALWNIAGGGAVGGGGGRAAVGFFRVLDADSAAWPWPAEEESEQISEGRRPQHDSSQTLHARFHQPAE